MADAFTSNQIQGIFGQFKPVLDYATVTVTANNVQGVFGQFVPVLDEAAAAAAGGLAIPVAMHEYRQRHQSVV